jgi:four helix bundle protein
MANHNFKELQIWKRSIDLAVDVYKLISHFPVEEKYGLTSQCRRSAVSIPSNIAEGSGRGTNKDFSRFLDISLGSSFELETQLILAENLFIDTDELENTNRINSELTEIQKMIFGFQNKLK